jgi:acyl-CoA hydrolase
VPSRAPPGAMLESGADSSFQACPAFLRRHARIPHMNARLAPVLLSRCGGAAGVPAPMSFPQLTPEEAAAHITDGQTVGFSGFTPAGAAKLVPRALATRAREEHQAGRPFRIRVITGASTGELDDDLAEAQAISWRAPYQSSARLRSQINSGAVEFVDMHLSHVPQALLFGFFGEIDLAVVEATEVSPDGHVFLTTSVGLSPTLLHSAKAIIIEVNHRHSARLREMTDIALLPPPPHRLPIPILDPLGKIGMPFVQVDPRGSSASSSTPPRTVCTRLRRPTLRAGASPTRWCASWWRSCGRGVSRRNSCPFRRVSVTWRMR